MQNNAHFLALDVGGRRIGAAIASSIARLPRPYMTLHNEDGVFEKIKDILVSEDVSVIVVGYPRNLEGTSTQQTVEIEDFIRDLKNHTSIPVVLQDEALTSHHAKKELVKRGKPYEKGDIDALAATYILEDYLKDHGANL